jgi:hypothetical protein
MAAFVVYISTTVGGGGGGGGGGSVSNAVAAAVSAVVLEEWRLAWEASATLLRLRESQNSVSTCNLVTSVIV